MKKQLKIIDKTLYDEKLRRLEELKAKPKPMQSQQIRIDKNEIVLLRDYFTEKGYRVEWKENDSKAIYINGVRFQFDNFIEDENSRLTGTIQQFEDMLKTIPTKFVDKPLSKDGTLHNVRTWFEEQGYEVVEIPEIPHTIYINAVICLKFMFKTYEGTPYIESSKSRSVYASEQELIELLKRIPPEQLSIKNLKGEELLLTIDLLNTPIESIYTFTDEQSYEDKLHDISEWKKENAEPFMDGTISVEEITQPETELKD